MLLLGVILALLTLLLIKIETKNRKLVYISAASFLVGPVAAWFYPINTGNSEKVFGHLYSNTVLTPQVFATVFIPFGLVSAHILLSRLSVSKKALSILLLLGLGYFYLLTALLFYAPGVGG